ncbi:hypothetical protein Tco_0679606 [Tanacetum coccineum]|uniref:Uncharacterized protein n=1 Tax=Tanacetum coccineum TaxID=301880 RepID=A0ABQ4XIF9_9ASTR
MSLEDSGSLNLPDAASVHPALEVNSLPKFDMHLRKSFLTETNVKWLAKCYGIPADLHPRVPPEGMTMDALPGDAIGLYAHHFQQGGLRGDSPGQPSGAIGAMRTAEIPCRKVLDDKERKRKKVEAKVEADANIQVDEVGNKGAGKEGYSAGCFSNLSFTSQWGLIDSCRMDNSHACRDMMSNLFTPADQEFFNEGVRDESAIKRSWKLLYVKARYKECKKELVAVRLAYDKNVSAYDQLSKNYDGALTQEKSLQDRLEELEEEKKEADQLLEKEHYAVEAGRGKMVRQKIMNQYLPTFLRRLHQSAEYKRSLGEVFSLAVGKGFIDGISIGRKEPDIQAILKATPNVDPVSSDTFMDAYEELFDRRYPYVDKVARMYLLDPSGLQNIMPDETGPTPGGGPRDIPTASYA